MWGSEQVSDTELKDSVPLGDADELLTETIDKAGMSPASAERVDIYFGCV